MIDNLFGNTVTKQQNISFIALNPSTAIIKREYDIDIDFGQVSTKTINSSAIFAKGDSNTSIKARLMFNSNNINLEGYNVLANIKEGKNDPVTIPVKIADVQNGVIEIILPASVLDSVGTNLIAVRLQKDDRVLLSTPYSFVIADSVSEGQLGTEEEKTVLQSLVESVQGEIAKIDNITEELTITDADIEDVMNMVGDINAN